MCRLDKPVSTRRCLHFADCSKVGEGSWRSSKRFKQDKLVLDEHSLEHSEVERCSTLSPFRSVVPPRVITILYCFWPSSTAELSFEVIYFIDYSRNSTMI